MFNKRTYRIAKKLNKNQQNIKSILKQNFNFILTNKKLFFYKKIVLNKPLNFLNLKNKNVCSFTGQYKACFNSLKLSRHSIRKLADISILSNYSKTSW